MNTVLKIFLSMSFSGSLLILALFLGKRFLKDKISRQWQYYIWLIVILRLLLPFGPEVNLLGKTYQAVDQVITQTAPLSQQQPAFYASGNIPAPADNQEPNRDNDPSEDLTAAHPLQEIGVLLFNHIWLIWLLVALGMLIRKITSYQGFTRYIHAGLVPVSDIELLDQLSIAAGQTGIKKPIELCINPLVSSPLLIGFFHPCIVLPSVDIPKNDFQYIILHELTHYKRRDMFYKWLVQITLCLHWFNPLVQLMSREITKACEFSCDEAVLTKMGQENAQDYGKTLLDAMAAVGKYKENLGAVTLSENKQLLKERLSAIMNFKRKSAVIRLLTGMLTLCVMFSAAFVGVYPVASAVNDATGKTSTYIYDENLNSGWYLDDEDRNDKENPTQAEMSTHGKKYAAQAERYYEANSLPLFQVTFSRLDENAQKAWLEKFYTDENFAFFSVAVKSLNADDPLLSSYAEKAYSDGEIAFFSTLTDCMDRTELELWLDRALEDENWSFQSMLFNRLDKSDESDELESEKGWAAAQTAEYQAAGVTMNGKNYYYQGQLVNIFLDIRANQSFYTLDTNPSGTVNIKITRDADDKITGVAYMTEAEVAELLKDMSDPDDK